MPLGISRYSVLYRAGNEECRTYRLKYQSTTFRGILSVGHLVNLIVLIKKCHSKNLTPLKGPAKNSYTGNTAKWL
jgi:hypothetical protein